MRILFVVGSCLKVNSSANLCHLAYIQGFLDLGHSVDVLSMSEQGYRIDNSMILPKVSNWFNYDSLKISLNSTTSTTSDHKRSLHVVIKTLKRVINVLYGPYGRPAMNWVNKAKKFRSEVEYDYVISLATPYVSHYLTHTLIKRKKIKCKSWIQIWEDPWTSDLYNLDKDKRKEKEEKRLLSYPDKIVYVSPLTLEYQKNLYPQYADKMQWHTLPYYYQNGNSMPLSDNLLFGYYGDYMSFSRNIEPFYNVAKKMNLEVNILGNSDKQLENVSRISVRPRVDLAELQKIEDNTGVLVFLCNLRGGQIPGKLYQYSVTNKTILFIMDGTDYEKKVLYDYFSQFKRYIFCDNNEESIEKAVNNILNNRVDYTDKSNICLKAFSPSKTAIDILNL
ncbi:MAG: hypothetical protein NC124_09660 [Clostridium sp.]|nr:hypothetical protein [Clostridium sp.]